MALRHGCLHADCEHRVLRSSCIVPQACLAPPGSPSPRSPSRQPRLCSGGAGVAAGGARESPEPPPGTSDAAREGCPVPWAFPARAAGRGAACSSLDPPVPRRPELPVPRARWVVGKKEAILARFMRCCWPYTSHLPCRWLLRHPLYFSHVLREVVKFQVNTRVLIHSLGT